MRSSLNKYLLFVAVSTLAVNAHSCKSKDSFHEDGVLNSAPSKSSENDIKRLENLRLEWQKAAADTASFWLNSGMDQEFGGIYGRLDQDGKPVPESQKQLSQQSRHLWSLSAYYRITKDPKYKAAADKVFSFLYNKFRIKSGEYSLYTDFKGNKIPTPDRKLWLYMHSFVIFSFAEYSKAIGDSTALREALAVFKSLPYDVTYGGYYLSNDARWYGGAKETNSNMHALEALTNLFEALPDSMAADKAQVSDQLKRQYKIFTTKVIADGFAYHDGFEKDWSPSGNGYVNFGHDFEITHLLLKTRKILNFDHDSSLGNIKKLAAQSLKNGYDTEAGGGFYKGKLDGTVSDKVKIWWVQCELMVALYKLYVLEPHTDTLIKLENTWNWIKNNHLSRQVPGAWYATPSNQGNAEWSKDLGSEWFASYHTMRALIEMTASY